jgi:hypothetical protein
MEELITLRVRLIAIRDVSQCASPTFSQMSHEQESQAQYHKSSGHSAMQDPSGALKSAVKNQLWTVYTSIDR